MYVLIINYSIFPISDTHRIATNCVQTSEQQTGSGSACRGGFYGTCSCVQRGSPESLCRHNKCMLTLLTLD